MVPKTKSRERRTAQQKESGSTALERGTVLVEKAKQEYDLWVLAEEYEEYER